VDFGPFSADCAGMSARAPAAQRDGGRLAFPTCMKPKNIVLATCLWSAILLAGTPADSQTMGEPERFTAFAVNLEATRSAARTATVEITIDRWSTPEQRKQLTTALLEKGPDGLLDALQDQPSVGRIRTPDSLGYDLRYSHQEKGEDGGRRIFVATDRPLSFWEAVQRPRSVDYPFTVIEIRIGADGTGEGKMSIATKITAVGNDTISLENYNIQPVMLKSVRSEKK
jgi:hypothetical protein